MLPFASTAILGLGAALFWGGGDFAGGMGVKRSGSTVRGALTVVLIGHLLSLAVVGGIALFRGDPFPHGATLWWGLSGGAVAALSLMGFYIALSEGHMGSAAAISGLLCAALPAAVSAMTDGAPGVKRIVGFLIAGVSIWRIAAPGPPPAHTDPLYEPTRDAANNSTTHHRTSMLALLAGLGFGFYFVALKYASTAGLWWGLGTARIGSTSTSLLSILFCIMFLKHEPSGSLSRPTMAWIVSGAVLDTCGNLLYSAATQTGRLDIAAVISSLYPASTILLAALILRERTTRRQVQGMLLAIPAVILITL